MKYSVIIVLIALSFNAYSQNASEKLTEIFNEVSRYEDALYPEDSLYLGLHIKGPFSKISEESKQEIAEKYKQFISRLESISKNQLTRQEYISKEIMTLRLGNSISSIKYKMYMIPFNAEGGFYMSIKGRVNRLPFKSIQDYEAYIAWLPFYLNWLEGNLELMQKGIEIGIIAPRVVVNNNLVLMKPWVVANVADHPLYKPFNEIPASWDKKDIERLRKKGEKLLNKKVVPFYLKLDNFLRTDYLNATTDNPGIKFLPQGKEYYEDRVNFYTTLSISPDSVHNLGIQEVARIRAQMDEIIKEISFEGSFEDFLVFLRTDEQFYAKTPQELLNKAAWLSKKAEGQLPKLFKKLYSLPFTVAPVPDDIAPTYTSGRFVPGSWKQQRPGTYWVNTYKLESRTLYTLPALTLHEAVPGHHLQGSMANELTGIPEFRTRYYISAFGEGWGLYSEFLGEEMGMYSTPYERFGRYTYEMWRACRLVVDTGIHYKGWSKEKAFDYMQSNTALSLHEVNTEIDRYIGWPGQAVSYKIGELKIKALRKKSEDQLGEDFDIREFHFHILKNGSVPLPILAEEIDLYIQDTLENRKMN